jgi:hypothetical protein
MTKVAEKPEPTPIAFTEDVTAMADYVRSVEGRDAIERGLSDVRQGRVIRGENALAVELSRRAALRRRA